MARDKVYPLKIEDIASGGSQDDNFPTALDANEDYVACRGILPQTTSGADELVGIERDASGNLTFWDDVLGAPKTLTELSASSSGITPADHEIIRQLIHFIDDGPAEGFASGAYRESTGGIFPTLITWWESAAKLKRIVDKQITYTGAFPTTITWRMFDTDGSTVLATVIDTISYTGVYETSRTRAIS